MIVDNEMGMGAFVPIDRADRAPEPTGGPVYLCGEYDADGHRVLRFESRPAGRNLRGASVF